MSGPQTVYPDPADNMYMTGVPCPYCGAGVADRCMTSGGNVYGELCHKLRKQAAAEADVWMTTHRPKYKPVPESVQGLKLALWYINTAGGVELAKTFMQAACVALGTLPEEKES